MDYTGIYSNTGTGNMHKGIIHTLITPYKLCHPMCTLPCNTLLLSHCSLEMPGKQQ